MKKLFMLFLLAIFSLNLFMISAAADTSQLGKQEDIIDTNGNVYWQINENDVSLIKSVKAKDKNDTFIVPDTIEYKGKIYNVSYVGDDRYCDKNGDIYSLVGVGYKSIIYGKNVKVISPYAHYGNKDLEEITYQSKDIYISDYAYSGCSKLVKINNMNNVSTIKKFAFSGASLDQITFGKKVKNIEEKAFSDNKKIKKIIIPKNIKEIGEYSFSNCTNLKTVVIKNGVKRIDTNAFLDCKRLANISIPNSVKYISGDAFVGCNKKLKLSISKSNKKYCVKNNCILSKNKKSLIAVLKIKKVIVIPKSVTRVKAYAINQAYNSKGKAIVKKIVANNKKAKFDKNSYPRRCKIVIGY